MRSIAGSLGGTALLLLLASHVGGVFAGGVGMDSAGLGIGKGAGERLAATRPTPSLSGVGQRVTAGEAIFRQGAMGGFADWAYFHISSFRAHAATCTSTFRLVSSLGLRRLYSLQQLKF